MDDQVGVGPVAKLLELGEPKYSREFVWPDYRSFGITEEHIPALIQIATDHDLIHLPDESDPRGWGPIHAWRALGQLQAQAAIEPLMRLFHEVRDNDWVIEEMPDVFAMIGSVACPALLDYLRDLVHPPYSRMVAATSLMQIALAHPPTRGATIAALTEQLSDFTHNSPGVNGVLIANLVELDAIEQADLIQKVFAAGKVDHFIAGDWRDIKARLRSATSKRSTQPATLNRSVGSTPPDPGSRPPYQEPHTRPRRPDGMH